LFKDSETGISQKFAFNLRYYIGARPSYAHEQPLKKKKRPNPEERKAETGLFNFGVNGTSSYSQKSYKYGEINLRRSRIRQN